MDTNNVKMMVTIPKSWKISRNPQGRICLGLGWSDELEPTHRVAITRTSISDEEEPFVSKNKIPIQSLGGLLQKISEAVTDEIIVDFLNNEDLGDYIMIEIYDNFRE